MTQWKPRSSGSALPIEEWRVATTNAGVCSESVVMPPGAPLDADGRLSLPRRPTSASCGVLVWRRGAIFLALCFIVLDFIELPQNRIGCWPEDERG